MKNKFYFNRFAKKGQRKHVVRSIAIGLTSLAAANWASALGLGEITLNSSLDQPLDAEVKLLEVRDLGKSEILIDLAEASAFERQGVDRSFFLTSIEFDVVLDGPGAPFVRLTSERPVREPFLNFIVEAKWPSGKLLREYTVLLDLPVFSDETAAPVSPVQTQTVEQQAAPQRSVSSSQRSSQDDTASRYNPRSSYDAGRGSAASTTRYPSEPSAPAYDGSEYSVQNNDTLWEIALAVRPDNGVSVHQTMMALHRANPEAFINGNINLLKAGRVLRVPDLNEIQNLNRQQAVRDVAQHNADWTGDDAAPLDASRASYDEREASSTGEGRLSLASPDDSFGVNQGRASGGESGADGTGDALREELAATQETLDKTRGENKDLHSKIDSLEDQIQTLESMLEISNESLRALELSAASDVDEGSADGEVEFESDEPVDAASAAVQELGAAAENTVEGESGLVADAPEDAALDGLGEEELADADNAESEATEELVEVAEAPVKKDPAKTVISQPKPSLIDQIMEYLPFIGLGVIAIIAGILFFIRQRSKSDEGDDFDHFLSDSGTQNDFDEDLDAPLEELEEEAFAEESEEFDLESELDEPEAPAAPADESSEPETEDVVAESDIYIAYGKYDQAEEMLVKALASNPTHHEARLKLLEVYAAQDNVEAFDPNYSSLRSGGASDAIIARAASLRESISGVPAFDVAKHETGGFEAVQPEDFEQDTSDLSEQEEDLSLETELDIPLTPEPALADSEDDLELDLKLDSDDGEASEPHLTAHDELELALDDSESSVVETEDSFDLDLDLDAEQSTETDTTDEESIEFDLEGLDSFDVSDDADSVDISGDLAQEDADVPIAAGLDIEESELELDGDDSFDLVLDEESDADDDIEFDLEGLGDLEIGSDDDGTIDIELDLSAEEEVEAADENSLDLAELDEALDEVEVEGEGDEIESFDLDDIEVALEDVTEINTEDEGGADALSLGADLDSIDAALSSSADDTVIRDSDGEDDTAIREQPMAEGLVAAEDDLDPAPTQFDMAALDEELDALTSDLDEGLDVEATLDLDDGLDTAAELTETSLDELDAELGLVTDLDAEDRVDPGVSEDAQAELDATIAEGEDILAELEEGAAELGVDQEEAVSGLADLDLSEFAEPASVEEEELPDLEEPEVEFGELDESLALDVAEDSAALEEPETDFDLVETAEPAVETEVEPEAVTPASSSSDIDFELPDIDPESAEDDDLDFLSGSDETATKLDLASAYIDMGDMSGAKEILDEILKEGSDEQQSEAKGLLAKIEG